MGRITEATESLMRERPFPHKSRWQPSFRMRPARVGLKSKRRIRL